MENNFELEWFYYLYPAFSGMAVHEWYIQQYECLVNVNIGRNVKCRLNHEKLLHNI